MRQKNKSENTIKNYLSDVYLFFDYYFEQKGLKNKITNAAVKNVREKDVYNYMNHLAFDEDLAATSRARKLTTLKVFFKYAMKVEKLIVFNPAADVEYPEIPKTIPKPLSLDEGRLLLNTIKNSNSKYKIRDYAMVCMFVNTGLRLEELVDINIKDIKNDTSLTMGKGKKERMVYFNSSVMNSLNEYLKVRPQVNCDALFLSERNQRISRSTVQKLVKGYLVEAGLGEFHTHSLRTTFATNQHKYANTDVLTLQKLMGHESLSTTKKYTLIDEEQSRKAVNSVIIE